MHLGTVLILFWLPIIAPTSICLGLEYGDFHFEPLPQGQEVTITKYSGQGGAVTIPEYLDGKHVTEIGAFAFLGSKYITSITFPSTITKIGAGAFSGCSSLLSIYFEGAPPVLENEEALDSNHTLTIYYSRDSKGWPSVFAGKKTKVFSRSEKQERSVTNASGATKLNKMEDLARRIAQAQKANMEADNGRRLTPKDYVSDEPQHDCTPKNATIEHNKSQQELTKWATPVGYTMPVILPPVEGDVDPEVKAEFDLELRKEIVPMLRHLAEQDKLGWPNVSTVYGMTKEQVINGQKQKALAWVSRVASSDHMAAWQKAEETVKQRKNEMARRVAAEVAAAAEKVAEAEKKAAEAEKKAVEAERKAAAETMRLAEAERINQLQIQLGAQVNEQAKRFPELKKYRLTANLVKPQQGPKLTSIEREAALMKRVELFKSFSRSADPKSSLEERESFIPFPDGIAYKVDDVVRTREDYSVSLSLASRADIKANSQGRQDDESFCLLTEDEARAVCEAIDFSYFKLSLTSVRLCLPLTEKQTEGLKVGEIFVSDNWVYRMTVNLRRLDCSSRGLHRAIDLFQ